MGKCEGCGEVIDLQASVTCPLCGYDNSTELSDPEDKMDAMLQAASIPNLASLFKAGKDKGLIKPAVEYGNAT